MTSHPDIKRIAAASFAEHVLTKGPGYSWRMGKRHTGAYSFRVTWAPGVIVVSGDIGRAVYQVWPSFALLWGAVDLISHAGLDYLCGKGSIRTEFDRDATVSHLLEMAYADLRGGSQPLLFDRLCDEYGGDSSIAVDRKEAAREFRDDQDLTAERVYDITGDFEAPSYSYPSSAQWTYEAVKLWAATMQAREPAWHRLWRRAQREMASARRAWRDPKHFRPVIYATPGVHNGSKFWVRRTYVRDGRDLARMASVGPLCFFGVDLSRLGLWRETGSSHPLSGSRSDGDFKPLASARRAV